MESHFRAQIQNLQKLVVLAILSMVSFILAEYFKDGRTQKIIVVDESIP